MPDAARLTDPVQHSHALGGLLLGALAGLAFGAFVVATGGAGLVVGAAIIGGAVATGAGIGEVLGSLNAAGGSVTGGVSSGSPNTTINSLLAARATDDTVNCKDHPRKHIAQGSSTVTINGLPAARKDDKIECGSKIKSGSPNVIIGGKTVTTLDIDSEVPGWIHATLLVVGVASAVVLAGPVVAAFGLAFGYVGGELGGALGGRIFGEGSDGQKLMALGGSLLGGVFGMKAGVRPAQLLGSRVPGPLGGFVARGYKVPSPARALEPSNATPGTQGRINNFMAEQRGMDYNPAGGREPSFWTGKGSLDATRAAGRGAMEDTPAGRATEGFVGGVKGETNWAAQKPIWENSSRLYAENVGRNYGTIDPATGNPLSGPNAGRPVDVFVSDAANPNSVYYAVEKPTLQSYGVNIREIHVNTKPQLPVFPGTPGTDQ